MTDNQQVLTTLKIKEIYSAQQIQARIAEMGAEISAEYKDLETPVVIGVMKGAFCFLADLVRHIDINHNLQIELYGSRAMGAPRKAQAKYKRHGLICPTFIIAIFS